MFLILGLALSLFLISLYRLKRLESYFINYIQSINTLNINRFLLFQNKDNEYFYKEQERWFQEIVFQRYMGYEFNIEISKLRIFLKKGIVRIKIFN
jgi:hypothetical protein